LSSSLAQLNHPACIIARRSSAPRAPWALKIRRWLQREYDELTPLAECYTRVAEQIFRKGTERDVLKLARGSWHAAALTTSPRVIIRSAGRDGDLVGILETGRMEADPCECLVTG
jgi:hypothetical protein